MSMPRHWRLPEHADLTHCRALSLAAPQLSPQLARVTSMVPRGGASMAASSDHIQPTNPIAVRPANATATAIYAHRHTVAYRLDRVRELTGLDPMQSEDRERLGLGLKAYRIIAPRLPR